MLRIPSLAGLSLVLILALATLASALPASALPASARGATITFEDGADRQALAVTGARFSTDSGSDWVYGDVRTRRYNAPHPESCADRPRPVAAPICEFAVEGSLFAWTGVLGAEGRIAFTERQATYVELSFSTGADLTIVARNGVDEPVATAAVRPNAGTGKLSVVRLEAPVGEAIASVIIGGVANFWLLDNLASDALPIPSEAASAKVIAALLAPPATVTRGGDLLSYTVIVTNRGRGRAKDAHVSLPLDERVVRVADARFSRDGAWVSTLRPDALELQTGTLSSGDVLTVTLRLALASGLADGAQLKARLQVRWSDAAGGGAGASNTSTVIIGVPASPAGKLAVEPPSGVAAQKRSLSSDVFIPGEPVGLWYHTPQGQDIALETRIAGPDGALVASFNPQALARGNYQIVAQGLWSGLIVTGTAQVE
jgi:hypothetical protein